MWSLGRPSAPTMAVGALVLVAIVIVVSVLVTAGGDEGASAQEREASTVALERRDLAEQITVDGTLGFADEAAVINRLPGTITWLPRAGTETRRGRRLFAVDGDPVTLMYGEVPAYRTLSTSESDGRDVKQLERNLAKLGFDADASMEVDNDYTSATSAAVREWQESLGLEETGSVELGQVVFQPGPRRVSSLDIELGATADAGSAAGPAGASAAATAQQGSTTVLASYTPPVTVGLGAPTPTRSVELVSASTEPGEPPPEVDSEEPTPDCGQPPPEGDAQQPPVDCPPDDKPEEPPPPKNDPEAQPPPQDDPQQQPLPESETAPSPGQTQPQIRVAPSSAGASGSGAEPAGSIATQVMTTSSLSRAVAVDLDPEQVGIVERGEKVQITLPGGDEVEGRIESVGTVAESGTADPAADGAAVESATIEITIGLSGDGATGALDEAPVTVDLTEEVRRDVFAVPVTALIGTAGDVFAIVVRDGLESRQIGVEPGLFADGFVEVAGEGLEEGLEVDVARRYGEVEALRGVSLTVEAGELLSIAGPSGSGKSTLLQIIGTLDRPSEGRVVIDGYDASSAGEDELAALRARRLGFIFQRFFLLEASTALDNVGDGLLYSGTPLQERRERSAEALRRVGLGHRITSQPSTLSGGERQRVAIARALVAEPTIILADEPTGNLDTRTSREIIELLRKLNDQGSTIIVVTHNLEVTEGMPRRVAVRDGLIEGDFTR